MREEDKHRASEYAPHGPVKLASVEHRLLQAMQERMDLLNDRLALAVARIDVLSQEIALTHTITTRHNEQILSLQSAAPRGIPGIKKTK
jgi:RNA polymerase-interacting CarD/CdnL/TRCF family regulator